MTLPTSGSFKASQINVELGRSSTAQLKASDSDMRALAGIANGQYKASNLYGKSSFSVQFDDKYQNNNLPQRGYAYITLRPTVLGGTSPITMQFTESGELSISSQSDTYVTLRFYCAGHGTASSIVSVTVTDADGKSIVADALATINYTVDNGQEPF